MDAAIISLLATLIATMFGGFWLLWRTIHKDNTAIRKEMAEQNISIRQDMAEQITAIRQDMAKQDIAIRQDMAKQIADLRQDMAKQITDLRKEMAEQNTSIRQDIADLRKDHARLEATMETLLKLIPTLVNPESSTPGDVQPGSTV